MSTAATRLSALFLVTAAAAAQADWRPSSPVADPGNRTGTRMAFDAARGELVLFGGQFAPSPGNAETWTWNGQNWTQRTPASSPPGRLNHEMCFDSVRQRVVLYGGQSGSTVLGDTWEWNGTTWTQVMTAATPPARAFTSIVYDGTRTLLFGGGNSSNPRNDLWAFDGTNWTPVTTASAPPPRYYHSMASNGAGEVLLFGGFDPTLGYGNATWRFDGVNWNQVASANSPSARGMASMAWDPVHQRYLLWSGADSFFTALEDTWAFANGQWTQLATARSPSSRARAGVAYYGPGQRMVVYSANWLQAANLLSTPMWEFGSGLASFVRFGPSVCPTIDPPVLSAVASQPALGQTFTARIASVSAVHSFLLMGFSDTAWSGGALPYDLVTFGTWPNCFLRVRPDATAYLGFGQAATWSLPIPGSPAYVGTRFHVQGFTFGLGSFPTNLSAANAATGVIDVN